MRVGGRRFAGCAAVLSVLTVLLTGMAGVGSARAEAPYTPASGLLWSSPVSRPHAITDQLAKLVRATPSGEIIRANIYRLGVRSLVDAFEAAFKRGVTVEIILNHNSIGEYPASKELADLLNADKHDDSWVRKAHGSTRNGADGSIDHQKSYTFSRVGNATNVVVLGSNNPTRDADQHAYSLMWQLVGASKLYAEVNRIFAIQAELDHHGHRSAIVAHGSWWKLYDLPTRPRDARHDPVMHLLKHIPANSGTHLRIAMFAFWSRRGDWITDRLVTMAHRGVHIDLLVGPSVAGSIQGRLRRAGANVYVGHWGRGRHMQFVHSKDWSVSYLHHGKRVRWTFVGSDNWAAGSLINDEATLGVRSYRYFKKFGAYFQRARHHR